MKIHNIDPTVKGKPASKPVSENERADGQNFNEVLKGTLHRESEINTQVPAASVNSPSAVAPAYLNPIEVEKGMKVTDRLENILDIMEVYRRKLEDSRFSMRDIQPIVNEMTAEKNKLQPLLNSLPDQDPLKGILNEAMIAATLEVAKFNRGDYI